MPVKLGEVVLIYSFTAGLEMSVHGAFSVHLCARVQHFPLLQPVAHRSVSLHRARTKWLPVQKISSPQLVSVRWGC